MAAVRGTSSDVPVSLISRFTNLRTAATHSLGNELWRLFKLRSFSNAQHQSVQILPFPITQSPIAYPLTRPTPSPLHHRRSPMTNPSELKTIGLTPAIYCSDQPLFHVTRGVPLVDALALASDFLSLAKALTKDAAYASHPDRQAWAAHYLTSLSKAVVDDAVKVMERDRDRDRAGTVAPERATEVVGG